MLSPGRFPVASSLTRTVAYARRLPAWRSRVAYVFLLPFFIPFAIFTIWPMINGMIISLHEERLIARTFVGLENYERMFNDPSFWITLRNTAILMVFTVPLATLTSLGIALVIYRHAQRLVSFVRAAFYLPAVASSVVMTVVWLALFNPLSGPINGLLESLGIESVAWLASPTTAIAAVVIVLLSFSIGGPVIIFFAGLSAIPQELGEAARIDGASDLQEAWYVTIPMLRPAFLFVLITQTIGVSQTFAAVQIMTGGGPMDATRTFVYQIYYLSFERFDFGYASAFGVLMILIVPVIAWIQYRLVGKEVSY